MFNFGNSLSDTGNIIRINSSAQSSRFPYGETYFERPTGRVSDGRLIIDFFAEAFGLPYLPPYLMHSHGINCRSGVNFAVFGATALDVTFFQERNISVFVNNSLSVQLRWFDTLKHSLCNATATSDCRDYLSRSLFVLGEIGGNDYTISLFGGRSIYEVQTDVVPKVIETISSTAKLLIEQGVMELVIPGLIPLGCSASFLTRFRSNNEKDYDPQNGCLKRYNDLSEYHEVSLQHAVKQLRLVYPQVKIVYANWYGASIRFYNSPHQFGFINSLDACCGGPGPYNYNLAIQCGFPGSTVCENPSQYVDWDGFHLTEAAYRKMAVDLLHGPYSTPPILC
ncbi:GDSL esterase/lipase [Acorus gramineus]|uniref:GDSL esterase/lipase n=1 Tax=Acorus gramineus TaxID=55184 RepID=A0AAV9BKY0_ACOGR|nr:GDSL esterase/lipase [Acorus gramineus]